MLKTIKIIDKELGANKRVTFSGKKSGIHQNHATIFQFLILLHFPDSKRIFTSKTHAATYCQCRVKSWNYTSALYKILCKHTDSRGRVHYTFEETSTVKISMKWRTIIYVTYKLMYRLPLKHKMYILTWCHPVLHIFEPFFQLYTVRTSYKRITLLGITLRMS